jgi:hypothetical protein
VEGRRIVREDLAKELDRIKSPNAVISTSVPISVRGTMQPGIDPRDVGVAIYFSKPKREDFRWQDALGIHDPAPTDEQILTAYRRLAAQLHPDRGGDLEMFRALTQHRDNALAWIHRAPPRPSSSSPATPSAKCA